MEGRVLNGRYRLISRLATGSMGQVWRGFDEALQRDVAAKLLLAISPTPEALTRFDREARLAGALSCPSIVTVHDYGHADYGGTTTPYLIMELLTGLTLAQVLAAGKPPELAQVLEWTVQVCDALAAAHRAGVVHRDIKPDNVMVTEEGSVKVLDFGIARFTETETTRGGLTAAGVFVGTAQYMSPEQAQGRHVDASSDLYSLGCLLYALITGQPPFRGDTLAALVFQHVSMTPTAPSALRPGIPPGLDRLVLDLLAKEPGQRPPDAAAVRARLTSQSHTGFGRSDANFAALLHNLGVRLSQAGRAQEALRPAAEAVELRRALSRADPDGPRDELAASLRGLGLVLSDLGRHDEALAPAQEAVGLYRVLATADPERCQADLAGALTNLGLAFSELHRHDEALLSAVEASDLYRALVETDPERHLGDLARSLHSLGLVHFALGGHAEALPLTEEAVELYRALAESDPDGYRGDLAASLNNLGAGLSDLRHHAEALPLAREAVILFRALAESRPDRYLGDLAGSLANVAFLYSQVERSDLAVHPALEAVDLYRRLTETDPERHRPALARSLDSLGNRLLETGREQEAEQAFEEAHRIPRQ